MTHLPRKVRRCCAIWVCKTTTRASIQMVVRLHWAILTITLTIISKITSKINTRTVLPHIQSMHVTTICALPSIGLHGDGRLLALNSYENRVYHVW